MKDIRFKNVDLRLPYQHCKGGCIVNGSYDMSGICEQKPSKGVSKSLVWCLPDSTRPVQCERGVLSLKSKGCLVGNRERIRRPKSNYIENAPPEPRKVHWSNPKVKPGRLTRRRRGSSTTTMFSPRLGLYFTTCDGEFNNPDVAPVCKRVAATKSGGSSDQS